jgi:MFS family permease
VKTDSSLAGSYWPTVAIALLALCPYLILSTALELVRPEIAASFGAQEVSVSWVATLGNAALALGVVISADLSQRLNNRHLFLTYQGVFVVGSLVSAFAPSLPVLIGGHVLQGLSTGLLLVASLPPLVTRFPVARLKSTIVAVVMGLFGAVTAGPLVGGYVAQAGAWRGMFAATAVLGLAAFLLALLVLPKHPPLDPGARVDVWAILLSVGGTGLTFYGVGGLMSRGWGSPYVYAPVALGLLALGVLLVLETLRDEPLMPVKCLTSTFPLMGILSAVVSGAVFTGLLQLVLLFLQRVRGLDPQATGMLLWPDLATGIVGAFVVGAALTSRWVLTMPLFGMLCLALSAWRLTGVTAGTGDGELLWISAALGLGASLTVTPGLLMAALSVVPAFVGRAIALVQMLRLIGAYALGPVLVHFVLTYGTQPQELLMGLHGAFQTVLGVTLGGILVNTVIFFVGGARLHPPRLRVFLEEDAPALESPSIKPSG